MGHKKWECSNFMKPRFVTRKSDEKVMKHQFRSLWKINAFFILFFWYSVCFVRCSCVSIVLSTLDTEITADSWGERRHILRFDKANSCKGWSSFNYLTRDFCFVCAPHLEYLQVKTQFAPTTVRLTIEQNVNLHVGHGGTLMMMFRSVVDDGQQLPAFEEQKG